MNKIYKEPKNGVHMLEAEKLEVGVKAPQELSNHKEEARPTYSLLDKHVSINRNV